MGGTATGRRPQHAHIVIEPFVTRKCTIYSRNQPSILQILKINTYGIRSDCIDSRSPSSYTAVLSRSYSSSRHRHWAKRKKAFDSHIPITAKISHHARRRVVLDVRGVAGVDHLLLDGDGVGRLDDRPMEVRVALSKSIRLFFAAHIFNFDLTQM